MKKRFNYNYYIIIVWIYILLLIIDDDEKFKKFNITICNTKKMKEWFKF